MNLRSLFTALVLLASPVFISLSAGEVTELFNIPAVATSANFAPVVHVVQPQTIVGPASSNAGQLVVFETSVSADWTVTPVDQNSGTFIVDSSGTRLYFASPTKGVFTVAAAVIVDSKPKILTHTFNNGAGEVNPFPPTPEPIPTPPSTTFQSWVEKRVSEIDKTQYFAEEKTQVVASLNAAVNAIDRRIARDVTQVQSQIVITVSGSLPRVSKDSVKRWNPFLSDLGKEIENQLKGETDLKEVRRLLVEAMEGLKK